MKFYLTLTTLGLFLAGGLTAQDQLSSTSIREDQAPVIKNYLTNIEAEAGADNQVVNLTEYFADPDDATAKLNYEIINNSNSNVAEVSLNEEELIVDFQTPGQTSLIIKASNDGMSVIDTIAIGVRPLISGYHMFASFEEVRLGSNTFWNGSDLNRGFISGPAFFNNSYNPEWFSWNGWACSEENDVTTAGYMNQYSAFSSIRLDSADGKQYGISYASPSSQLELKDNKDHVIKGFFVTNSTYTALSMKYGDAYTKKFGGADGSDLDWLNLQITGYNTNGDSTGTVNFRLADFTFENSNDDYIVETWQWVDLKDLNAVTRLVFSMSSTDNGDWGMNTPEYFCMDNLHVSYLTSTEDLKMGKILLYPNPSKGIFRISSESQEPMDIHIYTITGHEVSAVYQYLPGDAITIEDQAPGTYIIKIETQNETRVERIIIN
ncbi:MAG: DUF4465 domain-containing protein [Bacteroidales bacterium]|jgi:hypothetical protein|nr:DUF4465 domain-containing protein [Bacteroidales bacterium]